MMNKRDVAFLACRILGLYVWIHVVFRLDFLAAGVYGLFQTEHMVEAKLVRILYFLTGSLPLILFGAVGAMLWFGAGWLAKRMVSGGELEGARAAVDAGTVQVIAFSAVGLFVLVQAAPMFAARMMTLAISQGEAQMARDPFDWRWKMTVAGEVIQIVIGLWLLFGARGMVGAVNWLRRAGRREGVLGDPRASG